MAKETQNRPIHEIQLGRVKAAIWVNETEYGPRYSVIPGRIFKNDDRWETTNSFGRDELLVLAKVADLAHSWVHEQLQKRKESGQASAPAAETQPVVANGEAAPF